MLRYEEFLKSVMEDLKKEGMINPSDFPALPLYADQVANFISSHLSAYDGEDGEPVITKTMISNYIKHGMIPRPENKKYSVEHMIMLTSIIYLKSTFQINDIAKLMKPYVENYESTFEEDFDIRNMYESIGPYLKREREAATRDILDDVIEVKKVIRDSDLSDDDLTELTLILLNLAIKVDTAKYTANRLLKEFFAESDKAKKKEVKKEKKKQKED